MRERYQVLVLPYKKVDRKLLYCIFQRKDIGCWQFVSGGGETEDCSILETAKREGYEEANIPTTTKYTPLDTKCSISTECFPARVLWGQDCLVIPEYCFAVDVTNCDIAISNEHTTFLWVDYVTALQRLKYDSNKVALWELDNKIKMGLI